MKRYKVSLLILAAVVCLTAGRSFAQGGTFTDPNVDYTFDLPDTRWKMTAKPSATSPNVEYVFVDRLDGHLAVRKLTVPKGTILADLVESEADNKLQFTPGYVAGRQENFTGRLRGSIFNYEYVAAGRSMSGRFYFLQANETTVYLLRFTGQKDTLKSIRAQTDSIARTFSLTK
jgi:hypothetical protein